MATDECSDQSDQWALFRFFLGEWRGTGTGSPGVSTVERSYVLTLADQFVEIKNRSVYAPQEGNSSGEVHEDLGLLSYDNARSCYVLREFHVEGYVNQYVLDPPVPGDNKLVFVTEAIENIPPGWRARTTLEIFSKDRFRETFDLAGPDNPWSCYITHELHRAH